MQPSTVDAGDFFFLTCKKNNSSGQITTKRRILGTGSRNVYLPESNTVDSTTKQKKVSSFICDTKFEAIDLNALIIPFQYDLNAKKEP